MEREIMLIATLSALGLILFAIIYLKVSIIRLEEKTLRRLQEFNDIHNLKEGDEGYIDPVKTLREFKQRLWKEK